MENLATIGFVTAGMAIMALFRLLAAFRELRAELLEQRERLHALLQTVASGEAALAAMTDTMPEIDGLLQRIEQAERHAAAPRYEEAARLARDGAADGKLTTRCGLSRGEARLVRAIWHSAQTPRDTARTD